MMSAGPTNPSVSRSRWSQSLDVRPLWECALHPASGFQTPAILDRSTGSAWARMMILRTPVAGISMLLSWLSFAKAYERFLDIQSPFWRTLAPHLPPEIRLEDLAELLRACPRLPGLGQALPWILLAAPLYVLSLWLHDAVWDHGCLWMLRGLRGPRSFRITLKADAETLAVGTLGAALGLLSQTPGIGVFLLLPLSAVGAYFWILRGFALAALHGCPAWKGIAATLLHAALMLILTLLFLGLLAALFFLQVA
ncbi:MAG TPA: hypothetical protein PKL14_01495 [Holophaga sp.]|nr:hypothetical protein [Holophaga sp.]